MIGIIEGEQADRKSKERDDHVAIENTNYSFSEVKHIADLGKPFQRDLKEFFVDYHRLSGKEFRLLA